MVRPPDRSSRAAPREPGRPRLLGAGVGHGVARWGFARASGHRALRAPLPCCSLRLRQRVPLAVASCEADRFAWWCPVRRWAGAERLASRVPSSAGSRAALGSSGLGWCACWCSPSVVAELGVARAPAAASTGRYRCGRLVQGREPAPLRCGAPMADGPRGFAFASRLGRSAVAASGASGAPSRLRSAWRALSSVPARVTTVSRPDRLTSIIGLADAAVGVDRVPRAAAGALPAVRPLSCAGSSRRSLFPVGIGGTARRWLRPP